MSILRKITMTLLGLIMAQAQLFAQQAQISPVPQTITWGEKAYTSADATYSLLTGDNTDEYAIALIRENLNIAETGTISLTLGKKGEAQIGAYEANIPDKAEGYWLKISTDGIVVAGNDDAGTYYGVQTLLQILTQPEVMQVEISDWPACAQRGVIEGFYGNPWSDADRKSQFDFYGRNKLNIYVYGPKDDPYHRTQWRDNYPADKAEIIRSLAETARKNHVDFVWSIHTGGSISNNTNDFKAVVNKLEHVYSLGVRNFSIFFDDFGAADAELQVAECNYVWDNFVLKHDDVTKLSMCPTKYNAAYAGWNSSDSYLRGLGTGLREGIEIMWTGNGVADMINAGDIDFFNTATNGRPPFIWLNYPVNDYCIGHMLMGKFYGNDKGDNNFGTRMSAFTSNPMEYAEASKVALYGVADYAWNMKDYDPVSNWERAIKYLMPTNAEAFHVFCEHNVDLGPTVHGMRREGESPNFNPDGTLDERKAQYELMVSSADALLADTHNPALITEITPWLMKMKYMGQRGLKQIEMWGCIESGDTQTFLQDYRDITAIQAEEDKLISRDFEGTIKSARPLVADQVIAPHLKQQLNLLVIEYKKRYTEGWDVFPSVVLEAGNYYIKYNGKYLYNRNASASRTGDYPVWADEIDDAQPQKCEWTVTIDPQTGRYKIVNTQDGRYLNEKGEFWANKTTNPYDPDWHSYDIYRINGKYAIQAPSAANSKFLGATHERIIQTQVMSKDKNNKPVVRYHDAIFEFVPVGEEAVSHPAFDKDHVYYIRNAEGNYLTALSRAAWTKPSFEPLSNDAEINKYQKWAIKPDAAHGRWKIMINHNKFLDEIGRINKNTYNTEWNSLILTESGGQWAIQAITPDISKYWGIDSNNTIIATDATRADSYIFTIEEAGTYQETTIRRPSNPTGYEVVFSEDFDTDGAPDETKWSYTVRENATWNRFCTDDPRCTYVKDGVLHCKVIPNDDRSTDNVEMLSGGVKTHGKFAFRYGRAEASIMTHQYPGNFPAFWMMPEENKTGGWPNSGEIDIWESINQEQRAYGTVHTNWTWNLKKGGNSNSMADVDYTRWNIFRVDWTPTDITWYVNGVKMWTYSKINTQEAKDGLQWPFDEKFYLILNQSVGSGSWAASPDVNHTYETLFDWVRVYQKPEDIDTGIDEISQTEGATDTPATIYDLSGRKVKSTSPHGLYIINGQKIVR